jgi:hypothetical protein
MPTVTYVALSAEGTKPASYYGGIAPQFYFHKQYKTIAGEKSDT